jgi:hypothetical protein
MTKHKQIEYFIFAIIYYTTAFLTLKDNLSGKQ